MWPYEVAQGWGVDAEEYWTKDGALWYSEPEVFGWRCSSIDNDASALIRGMDDEIHSDHSYLETLEKRKTQLQFKFWKWAITK